MLQTVVEFFDYLRKNLIGSRYYGQRILDTFKVSYCSLILVHILSTFKRLSIFLYKFLRPTPNDNSFATFSPFNIHNQLIYNGLICESEKWPSKWTTYIILLGLSMLCTKSALMFVVKSKYILIMLCDATLTFGEARDWTNVWIIIGASAIIPCLFCFIMRTKQTMDWLTLYDTEFTLLARQGLHWKATKTLVQRTWSIIWSFIILFVLGPTLIFCIYPCILIEDIYQAIITPFWGAMYMYASLSLIWVSILLFLLFSSNPILVYHLNILNEKLSNLHCDRTLLLTAFREYLTIHSLFTKADYSIAFAFSFFFTSYYAESLVCAFQLFFTSLPLFQKLFTFSLFFMFINILTLTPLICRTLESTNYKTQKAFLWLAFHGNLNAQDKLKLIDIHDLSFRYPIIFKFFGIFPFNTYFLLVTFAELACHFMLIYLTVYGNTAAGRMTRN